ncbi:hypothetical protein FQZ97_948420 [compost metagenome]
MLILAVDFQHLYTEVQLHAVARIQIGFAQGQGLGIAAAEVLGQVHAVVGALALFTEHMHLILLECALLDQLLDAMMADHAVADDDQGVALDRSDERVHSRSSVEAVAQGTANKKTPGAGCQLQASLPGIHGFVG